MRSGPYKDDLAKVIEVDNASGTAIIHMLPRVDFQMMADRVSCGEPEWRSNLSVVSYCCGLHHTHHHKFQLHFASNVVCISAS